MLIGVDESGTFEHGSFGYFAAVHVRPSSQNEVRELNRAWEGTCRYQGFAEDGEVKGRLLTEDTQASFLKNVLLAAWPWVRFTCVGFPIDDAAIEYAANQRQLTVKQMQDAVLFYEKRDRGKSKTANQYLNMSEWWRARSDPAVLKVTALGVLLAKCLAYAVPYSAAMNFDLELDQLSILIDQGLWPNEEQVGSWKEILRNQLWHWTWREPVPVIGDWKEEHPFYRTFVEARSGDDFILKPALKDRIQFGDSKAHFEIRLADVTVSLVREHLLKANGEGRADLKKLHSESGSLCTLLVLSESREPPPNPYIKFNL